MTDIKIIFREFEQRGKAFVKSFPVVLHVFKCKSVIKCTSALIIKMFEIFKYTERSVSAQTQSHIWSVLKFCTPLAFKRSKITLSVVFYNATIDQASTTAEFNIVKIVTT